MLMVVTLMAVVVAFMIVAVFSVHMHILGRFRLGGILDGVGRTQGFAFQARSAESTARLGCKLPVSGCKTAEMGFKMTHS